MKKETRELIEGLKNWFEDFRSNAVLTDYTKWAIGDGEGYADEGASNMDKIISLLDHVSEMEQNLATGGLVKDDNGNWLKSGERVQFKFGGSGGYYDDGWHTGFVKFDSTTLGWYLEDDDGYSHYLAKDYSEVKCFEKIED